MIRPLGIGQGVRIVPCVYACLFIKVGEGESVWQVTESQRDVLPHFNKVNIATADRTRGPLDQRERYSTLILIASLYCHT